MKPTREQRDRVYRAAMRSYEEWKKERQVTDAAARRWRASNHPYVNALVRACAAAKGKK